MLCGRLVVASLTLPVRDTFESPFDSRKTLILVQFIADIVQLVFFKSLVDEFPQIKVGRCFHNPPDSLIFFSEFEQKED